MTQTLVLSERELCLAREAAEWRLISMLFECPNQGWRTRLAALAEEVEEPELKSAVKDALAEAGEGLFHHTFGPGGPAPAREASYHVTLQLGYLMSELQAYYNAFAFTPETAEAPDHISVETGFIAYLKLKEAYALACKDEERVATAAESAQRFLEEHLANMAQPLAARLEESGIGYLAKAGTVLSRRVGPARTTVSPLHVLQESPPDNELECGEARESQKLFG